MKNGWKFLIGVVVGLVLVWLFYSFSAPSESVADEKKNVDAVVMDEKFAVVSEDVNYFGNVNGYLARPSEEGVYPGVVMIHEWWGLNDNIKEMAEKLASQGYVVLAVDLYEGEVATESSRAGELAGRVRANPEVGLENMNAAIDYLKTQENAGKVASLGWCFGGGQSLQISLNNEDVDATVIYYGNLVTDESELRNINHPVLGIFGEEDTAIPVSSVREFDAVLDDLEIENDIYIYPGVGHAFANPSGANYAPEETEDAWMKTTEFLEKNL